MNLHPVGTVVGLAAFAAAGLLGLDHLTNGYESRRGGDRTARAGRTTEPGRRVLSGLSARRRLDGRDRPGSGLARWARARDLRVLTIKLREGADGLRGRLVLGRSGHRLLASEPAQSVIVFGPTQSLKTSGLAVPAILGWEGPVLATSVKSDLVELTVGHRRGCGEVAVYDPSGTTGLGNASWSPLPASRTWPGARRAAAALTDVARITAGTMTDGDFWYATAARMLAPLLFAAAFGGRQMGDVLRWVATGEANEVLELLELAGVDEAFDAARSSFTKEERQRSSIVTTVETVLEPFADGLAACVPGEGRVVTPINPAQLIGGDHSLYLCAPAHDQRRLTPLFGSVVREVLEAAYDRVAATRRPLDPPLLIVLDEAANIAPLPELDVLASTAAGHGVQLVSIWHDLAQLSARYGPRATTVVNNHRAKLFLSGISDPPTLDYASQLIGETEVQIDSWTHGGNSASATRSTSVRRLAPPDALRRIPQGEGVLVYRDLPPARIRLRTYLEDRWLAERASIDQAA